MGDKIVSVRMPESLMDEMKKIASEQHFMDLSDAVRSIVKHRVASHSGEHHAPLTVPAVDSKQQLIESLQEVIEQLQNGAKQEE